MFRTQAPSSLRPENFKNVGFTLKTHQMYFSTKVRRRNLKTRTRSVKSPDCRDAVFFRKASISKWSPYKNENLVFPNSSLLKSVFEKLCFRDGLVWTVGLTVEIKLRFRDGLVWTVGLTVESNLHVQIPHAYLHD